ncbi:MAG: hypothetical protein ACREOI_28435 [bacterium]
MVICLVQLYPLLFEGLKEILQRYPNATDFRWIQEKARNMGAWSFVQT